MWRAGVITLCAASLCCAQVVIFDHARIVARAGAAPLDNVPLVVRNGHIEQKTDWVNAKHVDLNGKTIIPALINVHLHIGYEGFTSWGAQNYTPENILDHLQRQAFYGVAATQTVGSSPTDSAILFQRNQRAGKFAQASRFLFVPGMAPPHGGPDETLMKGTEVTHAVYEISTDDEARAAVRGVAAKKVRTVKIWVDDRRGTYPKMTPEVYNAVIDEAHKHHMLVQAHAIALADQKAVVRAGADILVHTVAAEKLDEEYLAILRRKKPWWTPVMGLGDRSDVCNNDEFVTQSYPPRTVVEIREKFCGPPSAAAANREAILAYNFPKMIESGARLVLGTDAGIFNRYSFGWADHHELARYVQFGLTPAQALAAATQSPAELLGLNDMGTLEAGKSADFVVLDGDPLTDFGNLRRISAVYLHGQKLDRDALLAKWRTIR
jgi:imidazolonepropionase-like amidohydrolase